MARNLSQDNSSQPAASHCLSRDENNKLRTRRYEEVTYPSSIVTEFMMMQFVILALSFMVHAVPMTERLMDVFSPTCVDEPIRLSDPTWGGTEWNLSQTTTAGY